MGVDGKGESPRSPTGSLGNGVSAQSAIGGSDPDLTAETSTRHVREATVWSVQRHGPHG